MSESSSEQYRADLLGQLRYLLDEVAALQQVTALMHEAQITNVERGASVKQCYGAIIMRDRNELLPALQNLLGRKKSGMAREKDWNGLSIEQILKEVEMARQSVIEAADALDAKDWNQEITDGVNVYRLLLHASHKDTDTLREVAQKLYRDHS